MKNMQKTFKGEIDKPFIQEVLGPLSQNDPNSLQSLVRFNNVELIKHVTPTLHYSAGPFAAMFVMPHSKCFVVIVALDTFPGV